MTRFFRFSPSRLALSYIALGVMVLALFALPLWYAWRVNISTFRAYVDGNEMQQLVDVFDREGAPGLTSAIESRMSTLSSDEIILLADASKARLAGNLPAWPAAVPDAPGTYGVALDLEGGSMRVVASHVRLADGYHFLMGRESARFQSLTDFFWYGIAGAMAIIVILGAAVGRLSRRALLSEVQEISRTASAIVDGDLTRRLSTRGGSSELDTLARTVNGMLEQLARQNVRLESEIAVRRTAEQALHRAHDALEGQVAQRTAQLAQANESLRESEERYARAMEGSNDGLWEWNPATDAMFLSARATQLFGVPEGVQIRTRCELKARGRIHPEDQQRIEHAIQAGMARPSRGFDIEYRVVDPAGEVRWMHSRGKVFTNAQGQPDLVTGSLSDITGRKRAEEELRRQKAHLDELFELAPDAIVLTDLSHPLILRVNKEFTRVFGYEPSEVVGKRLRSLIVPDRIPPAGLAEDARLLAGEKVERELVRKRKDGTLFHAHVTAARVRLQDEPDAAYLIYRDISEHKRAEAALLESERQRRHAQRLEAMGTLAGGIAHDFNNILGAILGYSEMAQRNVPRSSRLRRDLDSIVAAGERGRALVDRILAFSRSGIGERVAVHVEAVVGEALDLVAATLPDDIEIEADLNAGSAAMLGDATQIHQVVMNLATNAIHAMPDGGVLCVSLTAVNIDAPHPTTIGTLSAADYIVLQVADSGSGIAPDVLERMFDPFFTTRDVGVGTGLGLSLVHGIVTEVGGSIDVETAADRGSIFTVYFPRTGDAADADVDDTPPGPRGSGERILVVDDEEALVDLATRTLTNLGYAPVGYSSSAAALEAVRADATGFDALITDERMPGLSGCALIREVRALHRSMPIVLVSGLVGGMFVSRAYNSGASEVLRKPFSAHELATMLARVLETH